MTTTIVNRGIWERNTSGARNTNLRKSFGEVGTVRVVYQNIEYVFGPGETKSFCDDGIAAGIIAADARLGAVDTREGFKSAGGRS